MRLKRRKLGFKKFPEYFDAAPESEKSGNADDLGVGFGENFVEGD